RRAGRLAAVGLREQLLRLAGRGAQRDTVLRAFRAGNARLDVAEVERQHVRIARAAAVVTPQTLLFRIGLDETDPLGRAARELEIAQRLAVDRGRGAGAAVLRRHVADRRAVGERQMVAAVAE